MAKQHYDKTMNGLSQPWFGRVWCNPPYGLHAFAAADALLLVDHVHAGLGVLGDGIVLTGLHALAALDADIGLCTAVLAGDDTDAAVVLVELLVERSGAGADTGQTRHAGRVLLHG